jgi:hypothetical protein
LCVLALAPFTACMTPEDDTPGAESSANPDSEKPASVELGTAQSALSAWALTISASSTKLWPTRSLTLTMTANQDVGPTPLFMSIWDSRPGVGAVMLKRCGSGTVCTVTTTSPVPAFVTYIAELTDVNNNESVENSLVAKIVNVEWQSANLTLSATPHTLPVGASTTLATHTVEIGLSPFYAEMFDTTTGAAFTPCGSGTACTATTSQPVATTHAFKAYLSFLGSALPPPNVSEEAPLNFVTWTASGYSLSLSASDDFVTAIASVNVGPTPYYIEIFDLTLGTRIGICGSGTTCSATVSAPSTFPHAVVAFISANDATLAPANIQASSNTVFAAEAPPR